LSTQRLHHSASPPWTLFELAGHFDIYIGLTRMLLAEPQSGRPGRDRTSFFMELTVTARPRAWLRASGARSGCRWLTLRGGRQLIPKMVSLLPETLRIRGRPGRAARHVRTWTGR
jgi:hypothetical protein